MKTLSEISEELWGLWLKEQQDKFKENFEKSISELLPEGTKVDWTDFDKIDWENHKKDTEKLITLQKEVIRKQIEENKEHAKKMGCEECWDWNPEICGYNCPDYHR